MPLVMVKFGDAKPFEPEGWEVPVRSSRTVLGPSNGGVVKVEFWRFISFLVSRFPNWFPEGVPAVSVNAFLLALNTGFPKPSGSAPTLTCGVVST